MTWSEPNPNLNTYKKQDTLVRFLKIIPENMNSENSKC